MNITTVYDTKLNRVAYLEKAFAISYDILFNEAPSASFSLPANDPKTAFCKPRNYVEIYDGDRRIDMFRIMSKETQHDADGQLITYHCEHVLATLLDSLVTDDAPINNNATADVLSFLLSFQTTAHWQLGTVDFTFNFSYQWTLENVLSALFSVTKPFVPAYQWTWDTSTYPWTLNLIAPSAEPKSRARSGLNLRSFREDEDTRKVITRLYPRGQGDGVNQLRVTDVNGGKEYIDAAQSVIDEHSIVAAPFVDRTIKDADTLLNVAQAALEKLTTPHVADTLSAADLYRKTGESIDKFAVGDVLRVNVPELSKQVDARIVGVSKRDVNGAPGDIMVDIANRAEVLADDIADINRRQLETDLYATGATNDDSQNFDRNCDPSNPAKIRFWVPEDAERINKVSLSYESLEFEGYIKGTSGGGGQTTSSGGGQTTSSGGGQTTSSGGGQTTSSGGSHRHLMFSAVGFGGGDETTTISMAAQDDLYFFTSGGSGALYDYYTKEASGSHTHSVNDHSHTVSDHTHSVNDHSHTVSDHTHPVEYGIYKGPKPTAITVKVDGNAVTGASLQEDSLDIVPYLDKNSDGRVLRGQFHTIEVVPDTLGRISGNILTRFFIQSQGKYTV
jgi:phage minor structural protein